MTNEHHAAEPWGRYSRVPTKAGWSFPLGQAELRHALREAALTVDELILFHSVTAKQRATIKAGRVELLAAEWTGRGSELWIYAVPSEVRARVRELVLQAGLPGALAWLAKLPTRGNAWEATRHRWDGSMVDGVFRSEERDAYFPPMGSNIGGA